MQALVVFDERKSHERVQAFINDEYSWLDSLAKTSQIVLFVFQPQPGQGQVESGGEPADVELEETENLSLEIAARFGIGPNELPGIIFFSRPWTHTRRLLPRAYIGSCQLKSLDMIEALARQRLLVYLRWLGRRRPAQVMLHQ